MKKLTLSIFSLLVLVASSRRGASTPSRGGISLNSLGSGH